MQSWFPIALVSRNWPIWLRYLATTSLVLIAGMIQLGLDGRLHDHAFLLFFPVIIGTAIFFDRGNGVFAALLSAAFATFFLLPPFNRFAIERSGDLLALIVFLVVGITTAVLIEALHVALVDLEKANTRLKAAAVQREVLLDELSHRMRNDLSTLAGLLSVQGRALSDPAAKSALAVAADRIHVLARVHQRLTMRDDQAVVDTREFITDLCDDLRAALVDLRPVSLSVAIESHPISIQRSVAVGLIINELLTNALKYAFPEEMSGRVTVDFARNGDQFELSVADNGIGVVDRTQGTGMGHKLVRMLATGLGGRVEAHNSEPGSKFTVTFPADPDQSS